MHTVTLASEFRSLEKAGDADAQQSLIEAAAIERTRVKAELADAPPDLWFTYHCYYKAPDLIGPNLSEIFGIPYVIAEASRAKKRFTGPWARFAEAAEAAIDAADMLFAMTAHDRFALDRDKTQTQRVVDLPPFLDPGPAPPPHHRGKRLELLTVAMMREGAKAESYRRLAAALAPLDQPWHLTIIGDGPARSEVEAMFPAHTTFRGALTDEAALRAAYEAADVFVWPGVEEAYGMVYLEAQAAGLPAVAEDHPGPRSVVERALTSPNDPAAFAAAINAAAADPGDPRAYVLAHHSLDQAATILRTELESLT